MYRSAAGRSATPSESPFVNYLYQTFQAEGFRVPDLMRAIAVSRSFYAVSAPAETISTPQRAATQSSSGGRS